MLNIKSSQALRCGRSWCWYGLCGRLLLTSKSYPFAQRATRILN